MPGKKEVQVTFKCDKEFADWMNTEVDRLNPSKSAIIRTCIMIGLPIICSNPSLVNHIRFADMKKPVPSVGRPGSQGSAR